MVTDAISDASRPDPLDQMSQALSSDLIILPIYQLCEVLHGVVTDALPDTGRPDLMFQLSQVLCSDLNIPPAPRYAMFCTAW